jgi:hypothetical protein
VNILNLKNKFFINIKIKNQRAFWLLTIPVFFIFSINLKAQVATVIHQSDYDAKPVRFGYFIGIAMSNYRIKHSQLYLTSSNTNVQSITSPIDYGIKMGGLMNFNKGDHFDIRLLPTVAIYSRKLWINQDPEIIPSREQAWFELPILFKYKSLRRQNMRMNMFVGLRPGFETNAINLAKKTSLTKNARLRTADFSFEYGAGLELFRQFFKLAPEVHFSHGLKNIIKPADGTSTSLSPIDLLDRLNTHTVTFYIMFE